MELHLPLLLPVPGGGTCHSPFSPSRYDLTCPSPEVRLQRAGLCLQSALLPLKPWLSSLSGSVLLLSESEQLLLPWMPGRDGIPERSARVSRVKDSCVLFLSALALQQDTRGSCSSSGLGCTKRSVYAVNASLSPLCVSR